MRQSILFILIALLVASCNREPKSNYPIVLIETKYGNIYAEIYTDKAPKTSAAFLGLVRKGLYDGCTIYRAIKDPTQNSRIKKGVIQMGLFYSNPRLMDSLPFIPHESPSETGLQNIDGTLTMARAEAGTAKSEFFICIGDQRVYDIGRTLKPDGLGYAAFGRVIKGMDVVRAIHQIPANKELFYNPETVLRISEVASK